MQRKSIGIFILVLMIIVIFLIIYMTQPERVVESFMDKKIKKDYKKMYSLLNIEESELINQQDFVNTFTQYDAYNEHMVLDKFEIKKKEKMGNRILFTLKSWYKGQSTPMEEQILLEKNKINTDALVLDKIYVSVPRDCQLYIDSHLIDKENKDYKLSSKEDFKDIYVVKNIFIGTHKFTIANDIMQEASLYENVSEGCTVNINGGPLKNEIKEKAKALASLYINKITELTNEASSSFENEGANALFIGQDRKIIRTQEKMKKLEATRIKIKNIREDEIGIELNPDLSLRLGVNFDYGYFQEKYDYWHKYKRDIQIGGWRKGEAVFSCNFKKGEIIINAVEILNFY